MASFRSFGGEFKKEARVSLAGRSRVEETRAEVLERTRRERERRRQEKLEQRSATSIQAAWRAWCVRQRHRAEVRLRWQAQYGQHAERAFSDDLAPDTGFLRELCYFANLAAAADVQLVASACRLVLAASPVQQPPQVLCGHAAGSTHAAAAVIQQAQSLVALCISALARHASALEAELRQPRVGAAAAAAGGPGASVVAPLVEVVLLLTAQDSWKPALGPGAADAAAQVLAVAVDAGLFGQLAAIVAVACPEPPAPDGQPQAAAAPVPAGEALATALTVRVLSMQAAVASHQRRRYLPSACLRAGRPVDHQLPRLLCLPLLQRRLPTLKPVAGRLWRAAVATLHGLSPAQLAAWLQAGAVAAAQGQSPAQGQSAALAAAALLGNLLEAAAAALRADTPQQQGTVRQLALQFAVLSSALLAVLPVQAFFQPGGAEAGAKWTDEGEEPAAAPAAALATAQVHTLPWDEQQLPSAGLVSQLHLVTDGALLRALVRAVLPLAAAADVTVQAVPLQQLANDVRQLCSLLVRLMSLPGQRQRLLIMLAFSAELVQRMWFSYLRLAQAAPAQGWVPSADASCDPGWMLPITLLSLTYSAFIITAGDDELYQAQRPLPLDELHSGTHGGVLALLKMTLWHALWVEAAPSPGGWAPQAAALRAQLKDAAGKLMGQLYDRNCRRAFAPPEAFQADALPADRFQSEMSAATAAGRALTEGTTSDAGPPGPAGGAGRAWGLLSYAPYLVPFTERARLFQSVVAAERARHRDMDVMHQLAAEFGAANRFFAVRRTQMLQDAYEQLNSLGEALHGRIRIQFIDAHGLDEAGVDGGGIFKEFLEEVVKEGFDPNLGLFKATTDNRLYPNSHAQLVMGNALRLIEFLGKMLGKAMYEGILVELPLAPFFLKKFRGAYCDINDLPTLDPELYRNLVFLKRYDGDVTDLGLTFTITDNVLGAAREVDLAPGGQHICVTADNRLSYIHRVADYRLNQQIREPAAAFLRGLHQLIKPEWVRMFNEEELQMLISGGQQGLDIADMRTHCQYSGGYHQEHPVIHAFWQALDTFTPDEQAAFLRFVTSCPRPPLLGFKYLEPPLCIQLAGSMLDERAAERLPTAATCMNLLKLPPYRTPQQIRDKLLYAVHSGAGFELS